MKTTAERLRVKEGIRFPPLLIVAIEYTGTACKLLFAICCFCKLVAVLSAAPPYIAWGEAAGICAPFPDFSCDRETKGVIAAEASLECSQFDKGLGGYF